MVKYCIIFFNNLTKLSLLSLSLSQGGSKKPENFIKAVGGVWRMITSDIGCVRLDFGQPFSLQVSVGVA